MEGLGRWVWRRWKHRFPVAVVVVSVLLAYVVVGWPGVTAATLTFGFGLTDTLTALGFATVSGTLIISLAIPLFGRTHFRAIRSWVAGDRSDPERLRALTFSFPRDVAARGGLASLIPFVPLNTFLFSRVSDESLGAYVLIAFGSSWAVLLAAGVMAVSSDLLLRPLREEISRGFPEADPLSRGWGARPRLIFGSVFVAMVTATLTGAVVPYFGSVSARLLMTDLMAVGISFVYGVVILGLVVIAPVLRPLRDLMSGTERVRDGDYTRRLPVTSSDEFGELVVSFNRMQDGLLERDSLHAAFGSYVDPALAERLLAQGDELFTGDEAEITVFFVDIRDFTAYSERATAREILSRLNALFGLVVPILREHGGHANTYSGDGVLAAFGVPEHIPDHADRAVAAAVEVQRRVHDAFGAELRIGIGINTGRVVAGTIGGGGKLEYALIGDAVNVASRVEGLTKETGDAILLTRATLDALIDAPDRLADRGTHRVRGKTQPVAVYALDPFAGNDTDLGGGRDTVDVPHDGSRDRKGPDQLQGRAVEPPTPSRDPRR